MSTDGSPLLREHDESQPVFAPVCDLVVAVSRGALTLDLDMVDRALAEADRAQALGPILDPTLARDGAASLDEHIRLLRAFRTYRAALEQFKPKEAPDA